MPSPYGWNNNYSQGITAAGGSHLIPRDFGDSRQGMGGMANRRGGSSMGRGAGSTVRYGNGGNLDLIKLMAKRIKDYKNRPVPNIREGYDKAADLQIGAATQEANQGQASYMANEGNRGGAGSALFGSGMKQLQLAPAQAENASIRAHGVEAQFQAERQAEAEYQQMIMQMNQMWQQELARRAAYKAAQGGGGYGSPSSSGGGGGFRVNDTPGLWEQQRMFRDAANADGPMSNLTNPDWNAWLESQPNYPR